MSAVIEAGITGIPNSSTEPGNEWAIPRTALILVCRSRITDDIMQLLHEYQAESGLDDIKVMASMLAARKIAVVVDSIILRDRHQRPRAVHSISTWIYPPGPYLP